ncbi:MAG: hypothetical protein ACFCVF_05365 [Kineosporiaceae bacterium]
MWRYFVLFEEPQSSEAEPYGVARLRSGEPIDGAEALTPEGAWRRTASLLRHHYTGEPQVTAVSRDRAAEIVTRWYATGVRADVPEDLRGRADT